MSDSLIERNDWLAGASLEDMRRVTDALYRVHMLTELVTDYQSVLDSILVESQTVADAEACSLLLYDEGADDLYFAVALGQSIVQNNALKQVRLQMDQGIAGECATNRITINVHNAQADPRIHKATDEVTGFTTRSLLAVPLLDKDRLIGVLEVVNKVGDGSFTEFDERIMEMFASLGASVIMQARLIDENLESERLAAIGHAVAGLAHYSKNILASITVSTELIDDGLTHKRFTILDNPWKIMKRSLTRLSNVIADMLAYSTERPQVFEESSLDDVIDEVLSTVHLLMGKKSIAISEDTAGLKGRIVIDPKGMYRCLLNLVLNAADALSGTNGWIGITATRIDGGLVRIRVEDNGVEIDPAVIGQIFNPFFSTKGSSGTGLGLAVTQKIVEEHGGMIEVGNRETGGAVFTIEIPEKPRARRRKKR